jgi:hypothetical protein
VSYSEHSAAQERRLYEIAEESRKLQSQVHHVSEALLMAQVGLHVHLSMRCKNAL